MLHKYSNFFFPICSVVVALSVFLLFFTKKNIKNKETRLYSKILIITLVESIYSFGLILFDYLFFNENTFIFFAFAYKILYCVHILWISLIFLYFYRIGDDRRYDNYKISVIVCNTVLFVLIIISDINLIYENNVSKAYGMSANILYAGFIFYLILTLLVTFVNFKIIKKSKKYLPLFVLILLMFLTLIIRIVDPYCNILSNIISYIAFIMYNTIENPDLQLISKLEVANIQAEKSNKIKNELISSLSHEIKTPLNAITGYSYIISESNSLDEIKESALEIKEASDKLVSITNNILNVAKLEANDINVTLCNYVPSKVIESVIEIYKDKIESKGLKLDVDIKNMPVLIGDSSILKQIILNFFDNAVKYTNNGMISIKARYEKENLIIFIKDTGIGISKEELNRGFDLFQKTEFTKDSSYSGLGLGIAMSNSLLNLIGGKMIIQSSLGKGTSVKVIIKQKKLRRKSESINC